MSPDSFFSIVYDMAIILAVATFAMCFLYLYMSSGESKK